MSVLDGSQHVGICQFLSVCVTLSVSVVFVVNHRHMLPYLLIFIEFYEDGIVTLNV